MFGLTRAGESPEEGKEEDTEKVRLYYNLIPAEYLGTLVRKSSTFTKLRHLAVITFGAYTSERIDTILK